MSAAGGGSVRSVLPVPDDVDGPLAPPRSNGELVFAAPWQSRAFGMAVGLAEAGVFTWDAFRKRLVSRIATTDRDGEDYYACWLAALEDVLAGTGRVTGDDVADRSAALARRPAGHDHGGHDHGGHDHGDGGHGHDR